MSSLHDMSNAQIEKFLKEEGGVFTATISAGEARFYWNEEEQVYYFGVRGFSGTGDINMVELHRQMDQHAKMPFWRAVE